MVKAKNIASHEPQAALLSAEDVDKDVISLSDALLEKKVVWSWVLLTLAASPTQQTNRSSIIAVNAGVSHD